MKKIAVLDTDFVSKTYMVKTSEGRRLITRVLDMPEYVFSIHEHMQAELERHNNRADEWLRAQVDEGKIRKYTDEHIVSDLASLYGGFAAYQYTLMTMSACDAFKRGYFNEHYHGLLAVDYASIEISDYLYILKNIDEEIGSGNNLGEIKAYVTFQWLNNQSAERVYYFCSDDRNARNGVLGLHDIDVQCISVLSVFNKLKQERTFDEESMEPYIQSLIDFMGNKNVAVVEASATGRWIRITWEQALRDLFDEKFIELKNGMLKYKE